MFSAVNLRVLLCVLPVKFRNFFQPLCTITNYVGDSKVCGERKRQMDWREHGRSLKIGENVHNVTRLFVL